MFRTFVATFLARFGLAGLALLLAPATALAQDFPSKPIRIVVANSAGTAPDTVARIMAEAMAKVLGEAVIVENRPGANMAIGYEHVAKSAPADGHTLALAYPTALATLPVTVKTLRFDPLKDLVPVIGLGEGRLLLVTSLQKPFKSFAELAAAAKASPDKLNYGSSSSAVRLTTEALVRAVPVSITHIPFSGAGPYYQAIATGEVDMGIVSQATANTFKDRMRVIAVTGAKRLPQYPDAPTFAELGVPEIRSLSYTLNVAAGTPQDRIDKLYAAAAKALMQPEVKARFRTLGLEMFEDNSGAATAKRLADEGRFFADIARKMDFKPQ